MSSPPPTGPPPSQPYPPPPQGYPPAYPPQYPPAQPYYGPPGGPPPKSNTLLIVAIVVVVVIVLVAVLAWWLFVALIAPAQSTGITVTGVSFTIGYNSTNHFFGPSPFTACGSCPINTTLLHQFQYFLTLHNHDIVAHTVTGITVSYPFSLVTVTPDPSPTPVSVPATGSVTFTLVIQPATLGGSYTLAGTISVA